MEKNTVTIVRALEYDHRDVTVSFNNVAEKMFGKDPFLGIKDGWWRDPLSLMQVRIGPDKDVKLNSIYKGKAVTSSGGFMDLSGINQRQLIYNDRILSELNDNLWVMIEKSKDCRNAGFRLQRQVLFEGKFGTGKTLSLLLTAKKGIDNGFTFLYLEPTTAAVSEAIPGILNFARLY